MLEPHSSTGRQWAIATPHRPAGEIGSAAFRAGGNAVDAALGAAVALAVTYPHNCSAGGDLFALVRRPDGTVVAVNASGAAPTAVTVASVGSGATMPERGPLTVTVPGVVHGWQTLAGLGARLGFRAAVEPAIALAEEGIPVARSLATAIIEDRHTLLADPGCAALFFPDGRPLAEGRRLRQPALARTLAAIGDEGSSVVYEGRVGRSWVERLNALGSPITIDDLAAHGTEIGPPLGGGYRDLEIHVAPPNSQGFVLLEILAAVEHLGLDPDPLGRDAAVLAAVFRRTSADRDRFLADPRHQSMPVDELLSDRNLARVAEDVRRRSRPDTRRSRPDTRPPRSSGDTIALVAADAEGWAVSLIQSLYYGFGAGILDPETGVLFHNRGACFSLEPRSPNVLAGGKRPLHTLMPVLAQRNGHLAAVAGTMGGGAQPQINAMSLLRVFGLGMSVGDALDAPRWIVGGMSVDAAATTVEAEARVPRNVAEAFELHGFRVATVGEWSEAVGHAHLIAVGDEGFGVATDPRADGSALAG
jgi:gamma-glutamyltranspeptidase